nr:hypothetical protein [Tanacetum cinerariifolium]
MDCQAGNWWGVNRLRSWGLLGVVGVAGSGDEGLARKTGKKNSNLTGYEFGDLPALVPQSDTFNCRAPTEGYEDAIVVPAITADNFELKHGLLTLVQNKQFFVHDKEDPYTHIRYFNKITSTLKFPNVPNTLIKFMLFPFSLKDQDSLNSAAGGNFLDKKPRECLAIIESKSKVHYSRDKLVVAKVSTNASTFGVSPDVAELKDMVKALLLDKKGQNQSHALVKVVEDGCVTCGGAHSYRNYPATIGNVYHDNIQEFVSQASAVNYNQRNTSYRPPMMSNQIRPPSFPPAPAYQALTSQTQGVSNENFSAYVKDNDAVMKNMQTQGQNMQHQLTNHTDLITKFVNSNTASTSISITLPSNTIANPKSDLKAITTRSVDYLSKWVEAKALPTNDSRVVYKLLKNLFARFGAPRAIISDRGMQFCNNQFIKVMQKYGVTHRLATPYHPQTSGQVEVSIRDLKRILERAVGENVELENKAYWALKHVNFDLKTACNLRKVQINELNELRDQAYGNSLIYKEKTKRLHDSKIKNRVFTIGDRVLLFNSRLKIFSGKLKSRWSGPFTISQVYPYGTVELSQPYGPNFKVNGHRVKYYFREDYSVNVKTHAKGFCLPVFISSASIKNHEKTAFTCPYGTFAYHRIPFGLCNARGTFQWCMMEIFHDMIEKTMEVFMDDFSVFGNSFQCCLSHLERMLK